MNRHFRVRRIVTALALIGFATYSTRDSWWRDIHLSSKHDFTHGAKR